MSGIAGIFRRDGRGADAGLLKRMMQALAHRGPDGSRAHVDGAIGLGHLALQTTPESAGERQPLADNTDPFHITFDGRIDNRDEIARALGDAPPSASASDAALVLRAYARWAEDAVPRLVGDFAFALWDARRRALVCARDALGIRPFYYHADGAAFRCASEPRALFADDALTPRPNEGFIAECLASEPSSQAETLFSGVFRLPPAHLMIVTAGSLRTARYWDPDPPELRCRDDEEYGERFREIFDRAVSARLRACGPVGAHLSGGLDSSAVVGTAVALIREGRAAPPGFETLSLRFPGREYDEGPYIDAVSGWCGARSSQVSPPWPDGRALLASLDRSRDLPDLPTGESLMRPLFDAAASKRINVVLTGVGGDQWITGSPFYYADLVRRGRWLTLARVLRAADPDSELAWTWREVVRTGLFPILPPIVRRAGRVVLRRHAVPRWIDPAFARRIDLEARLRAAALRPSRGGYARAALRRLLTSGWEALTNELVERGAACRGIEYRHPFYDRRLVEFALALPEEQRRRGRYTKFVLRTAIRGRMPEPVRLRISKVNLSEIYLRALGALGGERAFARLSIAEPGWVDAGRLSTMYRDAVTRAARGDDGYGADVVPLWMVLAIESWFRAVLAGERPDAARSTDGAGLRIPACGRAE